MYNRLLPRKKIQKTWKLLLRKDFLGLARVAGEKKRRERGRGWRRGEGEREKRDLPSLPNPLRISIPSRVLSGGSVMRTTYVQYVG